MPSSTQLGSCGFGFVAMDEAVAGFVDEHLAEVVGIVAAVTGDDDLAAGAEMAQAVDVRRAYGALRGLPGKYLSSNASNCSCSRNAKIGALPPSQTLWSARHAVELAHPVVHSIERGNVRADLLGRDVRDEEEVLGLVELRAGNSERLLLRRPSSAIWRARRRARRRSRLRARARHRGPPDAATIRTAAITTIPAPNRRMTSAFCRSFLLAFLQADRVDDGLPLHALQPGKDHRPLRAVHHDRHPRDSRSVAM